MNRYITVEEFEMEGRESSFLIHQKIILDDRSKKLQIRNGASTLALDRNGCGVLDYVFSELLVYPRGSELFKNVSDTLKILRDNGARFSSSGQFSFSDECHIFKRFKSNIVKQVSVAEILLNCYLVHNNLLEPLTVKSESNMLSNSGWFITENDFRSQDMIEISIS